MNQQGELLERPFVLLYETGGMRRVYLYAHQNILKRVRLDADALEPVLLSTDLVRLGTRRALQGRDAKFFGALWSFVWRSDKVEASVAA